MAEIAQNVGKEHGGKKSHPLNVLTNIHIDGSFITVRASMRDVSENGAGLYSSTDIHMGAHVQFFLGGMKLIGKVVRSDKVQLDLFETGVVFGGMGFFERLKLKKLVKKIMSGEYKPGNKAEDGPMEEGIQK